MKKRTICIVSGSRADYGLLIGLMEGLRDSPDFSLQVIVTGMHLSPEFGLTYKVIEEDGFPIDSKVEMLLSSDTPVGITKSLGLGVIGFSDAFDRLRPDLLVLLGDRYEILAAAQAALIFKIPIAHIAGGDTTEGAFDEAIRHCVTKMSHIHFVTNEAARDRVRQLGENPAYIFNVGSPGIDLIKRIKLFDRTEVEQRLEFKLGCKNLLITFHPVTLESEPSDKQLFELLFALDKLGPEIGLIFTKPNSDPSGRRLIEILEDFSRSRSNTKVFSSLGQRLYLSTMAQMDAVVGNSSSGLYEAPSLHKPTVDIGDRQKGRLRAKSVIHCNPKTEEIVQAIQQAFRMDCSNILNPYGDGNSSKKMIQILRGIPDYNELLKKHFFKGG